MIEKGIGRCLLHNAPGIHHAHAIAGFSDDAEIMADQHQRHIHLASDLPQQIKDLRLNRHIQRRGRLIRHEQFGLPAKAIAIITRWFWPPENSCG